MESKHTPGPWHVEEPFGEPGTYIAVTFPGFSPGLVCRMIDQARTPEGKANARLIAAAPDLLAALESLHAVHRAFSSADNWTSFDDDARAAAEAAIAKARGE